IDSAIIRIWFAGAGRADYDSESERPSHPVEQAVLVGLLGVIAAVQHATLERRRQHQGQLHRPSDAGGDRRLHRDSERSEVARVAHLAQSAVLEARGARVSLVVSVFDAVGDWAVERVDNLQSGWFYVSDRMQAS